ncbi:hypothetical protein BRW62_12330 [Parathermosynechococcus lividus PCC 6715]|uniref:Uncharacterized protein n=1 Tax=Parathermosynechococcus lividus PCC 6715 TaxID=1917166 RepID=A0A2D2Q572_PARLV|nr:hypothetical protein BRW62_12330 [Thermostichus lividus PCC 6715]
MVSFAQFFYSLLYAIMFLSTNQALLNRSMTFRFESFAALTLALSQRRGNKTLSALLLGEKGWG